jgi:hypothetical protein
MPVLTYTFFLSLGHKFCGPGTKLKERLARGDQPISKLDDFCRSHDIIYRDNKDSETRRRADNILADQAISRIFSRDAKLGERAAALAVAGAMKAKTKYGFGVKNTTPSKKKKTRVVKTPYKIGGGCVRTVLVKPPGGCAKKKRKNNPQTNSKKGGFLPLLPLLGALGALGSVAGGAASVASAVNKSKKEAAALEEMKAHNRAMERLAAREGKGVYLRLDKGVSRGKGVFLKLDERGRR